MLNTTAGALNDAHLYYLCWTPYDLYLIATI